MRNARRKPPRAASGRRTAARDGETIDRRYLVPGLSRGLAALALFTRRDPALTLVEVAKGLGLSRSAAFRLIYTLEKDGFVARDEETRRFQLTSKVLSLGFEFLQSPAVTEVAQPYLRGLSDR